jgi:hypothetical protein
MANTSVLAIATNIITAPNEAFAAIREKPSPWLPLLLVIGLYCLTVYFYTNSVDLAWMLDRGLANAELTDEQRKQMVDSMTQIPVAAMAAGSALGTSIGILIVYALSALYYTGVSFATNTGVKYHQWFGLALWCSLPTALGLLATLVNVLTGDMRFVPQEAINPLSFGNLLGIDPTTVTDTVQRILLSLDPTALWTVVLSIFGYQALSQKSIVHSAIVVLAPVALIVLLSVLASLF